MHKVGISANLDRLARTGLDAAHAFPALVRFLVEGFHALGVELHEIVRTDIHAGGDFTTLAAVALVGMHERGHADDSPLVD
jgi:hypothetical protein